jgi:spore coat polysaccharide biosynthesis protein SpsF (cytidylyltransferase family)
MSQEPKATCIVQARMGSERCPGKSLELIGSLPVVEVVLSRLAKAERLERVVLATSDLDRDSPLADAASKAGFAVFRGSETDLVGRYLAAAERFAATDYLVRATGDNVFMDWGEINRVVDFGVTGGWDFVGFTNSVYTDRINDFGGEFLRLSALKKVGESTQDPHDREHVFPFFYKNPDKFKVTKIEVNPDLHTPVKMDLDYPEDLALLQAIGREVNHPVAVRTSEVVQIANRLNGAIVQ